MLASVVAALLISAVWFWTSAPRVELTLANTTVRRPRIATARASFLAWSKVGSKTIPLAM